MGAMNISPHQALQEKQLRPDLFYRLNVLMFQLPPLRNRKVDILFLTDHFITFFNNKLQKQVHGLDSSVQSLFQSYTWPGNVRELKHAVEYMMNVCDGETLMMKHLPVMLQTKGYENPVDLEREKFSLREQLHRYEHNLISKAMEQADGNIQQAAKLLQIPRQTLQYKLKKKSAE
jgi:arginine utilization regulatory protein